jgi:uncharacterized damage-inducible protein DinB
VNCNDIRTLLDYHYWARDRVLDAVALISDVEFTAARGSSFSSIRDTLAHTYFAEWAWYSRWRGNPPAAFPALDQFANVAQLRAAWTTLQQDLRGFVDAMSDDELHRIREYRLMSGAIGASPLWQMVQHVVNHASYHRGQITTMLRQAGAQPSKSMDMIAFYRERS